MSHTQINITKEIYHVECMPKGPDFITFPTFDSYLVQDMNRIRVHLAHSTKAFDESAVLVMV